MSAPAQPMQTNGPATCVGAWYTQNADAWGTRTDIKSYDSDGGILQYDTQCSRFRSRCLVRGRFGTLITRHEYALREMTRKKLHTSCGKCLCIIQRADNKDTKSEECNRLCAPPVDYNIPTCFDFSSAQWTTFTSDLWPPIGRGVRTHLIVEIALNKLYLHTPPNGFRCSRYRETTSK